MKTTILMISLLVAIPAFALDSDKISHFAGTSVLSLGVDTLFYRNATEMGPAKRVGTTMGLSIIPGIAIETMDEFSRGKYFNWYDLLADGVGAAVGSVTGELVNGQFWISASGRQIRLIGHW